MDKKIFWKFNIIDILLIAILVISLIALIYKLTWGKTSGEISTYTFTYVCDAAPRELANQLTTNVSCADGDSGTELGKLVHTEIAYPPLSTADTTTSPQTEEEMDGNTPLPTATPTAPPETVKITLQSELEGKAVEHGVEIEDILYLKGKSFHLIVDQTLLDVYISDIEKHDASQE